MTATGAVVRTVDMHGINTDRRALEREALRNVIQQWNANRLDIFELSEPNEDLEFHGVMRFYFQDSGQKVATKCIRVASDATVEDVIGTLIEKFRPDMRMLSVPSYALFELHEHCAERKMAPDEKPLLVQLNWHVDDREGRFLLRNIDDKTLNSVGLSDSNLSFKRKLSKREKKQLKKQEKLSRMKSDASGENEVAEKLYSELPETSFTRSISNPEAVMRRRRQQKLERKLQQFRSKDGGPDTGGTLKIYGEALCRDVPYKTLLLSVRDTAGMVVREMLDKYGLIKIDPQQWCLVQVTQGTQGSKDVECVLDDDECPLGILMNAPTNSSIMFHVRRRPADCAPRKRKKKPGGGIGGTATIGSNREHHNHRQTDAVPILVELGPDGSAPHLSDAAKTIRLSNELMEVGSSNGIALQLYGPHIQPRHCVITATPDGVTALTPCHTDAHTYVNGQRIHQTTALTHGALIKFGNSNTYRYLDPLQEVLVMDGGGSGKGGSRLMGSGSVDTHSLYDRSPQTLSPNDANKDNFETTFDLEGNVETISTASGPKEDSRSIGSASDNRLSGMDRPYPQSATSASTPGRGQDPILPAVLEFPEEHQDQFLARVITHLDVGAPTFRLSPAFTLYLCGRYRASTHYRPELTPTERAHKLTLLLQHAAMLVRHTVQDRSTEAGSQAFWLANASELLHFLKSDRHVSAFSLQAQDTLADAVQLSFKNLVACLTDDLNSVLITLLSDGPETCPQPIVDVLSAGMQQFRNCRVNAALTIQFFSQLFHWLSARALSVIVNNPSLCCRGFGHRLGARLRSLQIWAESQGLELAAECHLSKVIQCATLLQANKATAEELARLSAACFKLNSLQLRALLTQYKAEPGEAIASASLLDQAARAAEDVADELARADGREVRLHDDPTLHLQLLLPDDGYSCDVVVGVPPGLADFLHPLQASGLCRLAAQPTSSGQWTVYMTAARPTSAMSTQQPELQVIRLHKTGGGMGLSIVAAKGAGQERLGIYIKSVVPGGAADRDGRLAAGDQLLSVDGQSLLGITQEKAAEFLVRTGSVVTLSVAKGGAVYHGLATLLQQPSPTPQRGGRRMSERDLPSRVDADSARIPSSKSVPTLHHISPNSEASAQQQHPHTLPHHHHHSSAGGNVVTPPGDNFNPGYSRTSSSNSIHQQQQQARSKSTHSLYQQQQQQQQQQDGFYQNLSVYRNSAGNGNGSESSPKQLGDRTSAHRISQNSLHTPNQSHPPSHHHHHQQNQPAQPQSNRPVSAYYNTTTTTTDPNINTPPASGRLPLHLSIPNLKNIGNTANSPQYSQHLLQQQYQHQQQRAMYNTANNSSHPNMIAQQQQILMMQQQFAGYGSPTQSVDGAYGSPNGGFVQHTGHQGLLQEDVKYTIHGRQDEMVGGYSRRQENGYGPPNGDQLMRTSKSEDLLRQSQPNLHQSGHEQLRYASSVGNVTRAQESSRVELPQLRHALNDGATDNMPTRGQAKLVEMGEELRRRQQREQQQQQNNMYVNKPPHHHNMQQQQQVISSMQNLSLNQQQQHKTPAVAPKPPLSNNNNATGRIPSSSSKGVTSSGVVDDVPELPPTTTHPLYVASAIKVPSVGRDPWAREEREREAEMRREQARHWQEQQIRELQALPQRSVQQEEQLRVLRLEREFQRRAQEASEQDEEDTEKDSPVHPSQQPPRHQHQVSSYPKHATPNIPMSTPATVSILKHQQSAPNLLPSNQQISPNINSHHHVVREVPTSLALSHQHIISNLSPSNNHDSTTTPRGGASVNLNHSNAGAPPPPERASSYQVMSMRNQSNTAAAAAAAVNREGPKRVSFNDVGNAGTAAIAVQDVIDSNRKDMIREDPDAFIRQAESMLASPTSPNTNTPLLAGGTPGVIGAQEVYRDPRTRRLAEQEQQKTASAPSVPEKLTFKEKMKMFAMETGESNTPRDKSKISRAQRDIDNMGGNTTTPTGGQQTANSNLVH